MVRGDTMRRGERETTVERHAGSGPVTPEARLPDRIIVVSDLHLGEGVAPIRGRVSGEHFFHDREFRTWLDRLTRRAMSHGWQLELVLNGDVFDFLRVVRLPDDPGALAAWRRLLRAARVRLSDAALHRVTRRRFTFRERTFGLGTDESSCIWKLSVIAAARSEEHTSELQ